jgi:hypothetical protein
MYGSGSPAAQNSFGAAAPNPYPGPGPNVAQSPANSGFGSPSIAPATPSASPFGGVDNGNRATAGPAMSMPSAAPASNAATELEPILPKPDAADAEPPQIKKHTEHIHMHEEPKTAEPAPEALMEESKPAPSDQPTEQPIQQEQKKEESVPLPPVKPAEPATVTAAPTPTTPDTPEDTIIIDSDGNLQIKE